MAIATFDRLLVSWTARVLHVVDAGLNFNREASSRVLAVAKTGAALSYVFACHRGGAFLAAELLLGSAMWFAVSVQENLGTARAFIAGTDACTRFLRLSSLVLLLSSVARSALATSLGGFFNSLDNAGWAAFLYVLAAVHPPAVERERYRVSDTLKMGWE